MRDTADHQGAITRDTVGHPDTTPDTTMVSIYGQEYRIGGSQGGAAAQEAAAYVDARMRAAAARAPHLSRAQLTVVAALELAAEVLSAQSDRQQLLQRAADNIDRLSELVDQRSTLLSTTSEWMAQRVRRRGAPRLHPGAEGPTRREDDGVIEGAVRSLGGAGARTAVADHHRARAEALGP